MLASNNVFGSDVVVSAMVNTNNTPEITLVTSENNDVTNEDHSSVVTDNTEETGKDVSDENNSSDVNGDSVTDEEGSEDGTDEEESEDGIDEEESEGGTDEEELEGGTDEEESKNGSDEEELEEYKNNNPPLESSSQIQPTTVVNVSNEDELNAKLNSDNILINLTQNIELTAPLEIVDKNTIVIDGQGKKITFKKDATNKKNMFVVKNSNAIVVKNVTIEDYYTAAILLYNSTNVFLEDVDLIGQPITNPDDSRSLVGVDLDGSTANIKNIKSMNHRYAGIRVRNGSTLTLDGWNEHTDDTNDIDSQVISGQENNIISDKSNNYSEWEVKLNADPTITSTIYKVKTLAIIDNFDDFKKAIAIDNVIVKLQEDITLTGPLEINGKNTIVIDGQGHTIKLNEGTMNEKQNMFVVKRVNGIVVKDVTLADYYSTGISLYKTTNAIIEGVVLNGQPLTNSKETRSNVGIDLDESIAEIRDMKSMNHKYAGIRVRNESELTLDGWNEHTDDTNDIDSQVKTGSKDNIIKDNNSNYSEWKVKTDTDQTSTIYKVKTFIDVNDLTDFKKAIEIENTTITLKDDLDINEKIEIKADNITLKGDSHQINIISNASTNDGTNTSSLVVRSKNAILSNLTINNNTTKPGLTLYGAENVDLSDIEIVGIESDLDTDTNPDYDQELNPDPEEDPDSDLPDTNLYSDTSSTNATSIIERSGVALDIYNSKNVKLNNINSHNSLYRDFQIRGGSQVEILSQNAHSTGAVHIQSIQKADEPENVITDASDYYIAGVPFEEIVKGDGDNKDTKVTKVDYFLKVEKDATTIYDILDNIKNGGTVVKLQNDITLDWDKLPEYVTEYLKIEVGRNVTIDGNGYKLDLNGVGTFVIKGKDVIVKNITIDNSFDHGVNIYNSRNVLLDKVVLSNSYESGIFVNGSTVVLRDVSTLYNAGPGIKITRSRTLRSPSHFDSVVEVKGTLTQKESNVSVNISNLEMVGGRKQDNKFIPQEGTYIHHINDEKHQKLSDYYIELLGIKDKPEAEKEYWEQEIDYLVPQDRIVVTEANTLFDVKGKPILDEDGKPIQLVGDGETDNTKNLIKLIKYAASHSQELYFPTGTYKITEDINLSDLLTEFYLPAASNFKLTGDPNGLSIIDGSSNVNKMLKIFNDEYHGSMNYVDFEHLVFNNVGVAINGPYKKGITLKHNVFINGNYTREKRADGSVSKATMEPYIEVKNSKYVIENNIFLRGQQYPGRGIATYRSKNTTIKNNFFGNLDGIDDAVKMFKEAAKEDKEDVDEIASKLSMIKESKLVNGDQGNFFTAINNERYDTNVLIQNNYFNLMKTRNVVSDFASNTLISGINVAADGQRRDHIIYSKGYDNLQIVGNYFKGQENGAAGGVKIRNGKNAYVGANYFDDVPLLTYIYPDLTKAETLLHNTVIYNNLFHQKTNFGGQGTGILFYQSFREGENLTYRDGEVWNNAHGDVKDFIIYKNEFKSDERDRITISGRAKKAFKDNQFLAYGNKYKNTDDELVNYNTQGNFGLTESNSNEIQVKAENNSGYKVFNDVEIPLTPAKVDYTYLKPIYEKAKSFLDELLNNDLVGYTAGKYPTDLVDQLQAMLDKIKELYNDGQLHQLETNHYVTALDKLYERVKNSKITGGTGSGGGSGSGNGSDSDDESGSGDSSGSDNESGSGDSSGSDDESGSGDSSGSDDESDSGDSSGSDGESGSGNGTGSGNGAGSGSGTGSGSGNGTGSGNGPGPFLCTELGSGPRISTYSSCTETNSGSGSGNGSGIGSGAGSGNGSGSVNESGSGAGSGNETRPSTGSRTESELGNESGPNSETELGNDSGSNSESGLCNELKSSKKSYSCNEVDSANEDSSDKDSSDSNSFNIINFVWLLPLLLLLLLLRKRKKKEEVQE